MWGRLKDVTKNARSLNMNKALRFALNDDKVKKFIISMNTQEQLYDEGINSDGVNLEAIGGEYSSYTIMLKEEVGQVTDRITLYDTGEFYSSFKVRIGAKEFTISANTIKDDDDLTDRWGEEIIGLTNENIWRLILAIREKVIEHLLQQLLRGR